MKNNRIPKIPEYYIEEINLDSEEEISDTFINKKYSPTDHAVLKTLGLSKTPLSPYDIETIVNKAYNQVYYSCKKLNEYGLLIKSETTSAKKGKKFVYSLSYLGYLFCIASVERNEFDTILRISQNCRDIIRGIDLCLSALEEIKTRYTEEDLLQIEKTDNLVTLFITGVDAGIPVTKKTYLEKITEFIAETIWLACISICLYLSEKNMEKEFAQSVLVDLLIERFIVCHSSHFSKPFTTILIDDILPAFQNEPEYKNIRSIIEPELIKLIYKIKLYGLILNIPDEAEINLNNALKAAFNINI